MFAMCVSHPKRFKQVQQVQIRISANRLGGKSVGELVLNRFRFRFESDEPLVRLDLREFVNYRNPDLWCVVK